jgi:hypothetical protein
MNITKTILNIAFLVTISQSTYATPFSHTPEYSDLNQHSYQSEMYDPTINPNFTSYCEKYARVANRQAQRRINKCANHIRFTGGNIRARWGQQYWNHKNWCESVPVHRSGNENRIRENQLKNCLINLPVQLTIQQCKYNDKFHKAAASGNINFVRRCLDIGLNINLREKNRWTALHSAANNGRLNIVRLLVRQGAHINVRDINNRSPLDLAKIANRRSIVNYLSNQNVHFSRPPTTGIFD